MLLASLLSVQRARRAVTEQLFFDVTLHGVWQAFQRLAVATPTRGLKHEPITLTRRERTEGAQALLLTVPNQRLFALTSAFMVGNSSEKSSELGLSCFKHTPAHPEL